MTGLCNRLLRPFVVPGNDAAGGVNGSPSQKITDATVRRSAKTMQYPLHSQSSGANELRFGLNTRYYYA